MLWARYTGDMRVFLMFCTLLWSALATADEPTLPTDASLRWVAYTPSDLDPRVELNHEQLSTRSLDSDLSKLSEAFDGLVLYAYHPMVTPRLVWLAQQHGFRAIMLGIWQPRSIHELDGIIALYRRYQSSLSLAIVVGNEGINFGRYEFQDLLFAKDYLRTSLGSAAALTTSEPLVGYEDERLLHFGDFLAPNIHPAIDRVDLSPEDAADWARSQALRLADASAKPVIVKETGLPRGGRDQYNPEAQAGFWQHYTDAGLRQSSGDGTALFNVAFEAFDLPWKTEASGMSIEAWWGLLTAEREATPAFEVWKSMAAEDDTDQ